jgi:hypothetical protein
MAVVIPDQVEHALAAVDQALAEQAQGSVGPYSDKILRDFRRELVAMREHWPAQRFRLGRVIIDEPDTDLGLMLLRLDSLARHQQRRLELAAMHCATKPTP